MKKALLFILVAAVACTPEDFIRGRVEGYVRKVYSDCDKILYYSVDTVTVGDNLDYRIEQAGNNVKFAEEMLELAEKSNMDLARYGVKPNLKRVEDAESDLHREKARAAALDSLRSALGEDVLSEPAAFSCCVAYNYPSNLVWVQVDPLGNLLAIDKDKMKTLINPGKDAPGYREINDRFMKK